MHKISKGFWVWLALELVAITLPFPQLKINTWCIWLLIFVWLISNSAQEKLILLKSRKLIWLFLSVFLIYALGLAYGNFKIGLFEIEKKLALLIFPIVLGTLPKIETKRFNAILISYALACVFIGMVCLSYTFFVNYSNGIEYSSANSWLFSYTNLTDKYGFHPSYFSVYCILSLYILLNLLLEKNTKTIVKILLIAAIIYLIIFVFLLASRIGLLALSIIFVCSIIGYAYRKRKLLYGMLTLAFVFVAVIYSLQFFTPISTKLKGLFDTAKENPIYSGSFRVELWKSTWEIIQDNVWTGVGTGDLQPALNRIYENITSPNKEYYNYNIYNSHNQFLDIAATVGILALFLFLFSLFYPVYIAFKRGNYLYILFIFLFVFLSSVECTLSVQKGVVWFAFFNSLFAFHSIRGNKDITD